MFVDDHTLAHRPQCHSGMGLALSRLDGAVFWTAPLLYEHKIVLDRPQSYTRSSHGLNLSHVHVRRTVHYISNNRGSCPGWYRWFTQFQIQGPALSSSGTASRPVADRS